MFDTASTGGHELYWADLHKHMSGPGVDIGRLDEILGYAKEHLDAGTVLCYPFKWFRKGRDPGIREETVGTYPEFETWWDAIGDAAARHNDPGTFVTIPAFEWHGNRTRWGDHNVLYFEEGYPLDDEWDVRELYATLREREALAIPHHTAYSAGNRAKDWSEYDPELSPVTEVYSSHGSSEGVATPVAMDDNHSMGPRTSGGTFRDALDRGHRVGAIASNDGPGLPGTWNRGLAGLWADDLTREALREALTERRTYGVTGDRIRLWWEVDGVPLGSVVDAPASTGRVLVDCPQPLDRVDLVHDGQLADRYTHVRTGGTDPDGVYRLLIEFGWGPTGHYGAFDTLESEWEGSLRVDGGTLQSVTPRFVGFGQRYEHVDDTTCRFDLLTVRGERDMKLPEGNVDQTKQGLILEVEGDEATTVDVDLADADTLSVALGAARERSHLFAFVEESADRIEREFELDPDAFENPDPIYHNARKVKFHPAHPRSDCTATATFDLPADDEGGGDEDYYYVRAAQVDGQYAWSSPVWAA